MLQREKSLHVIINVSIRAKDEIEGWGPFGDKETQLEVTSRARKRARSPAFEGRRPSGHSSVKRGQIDICGF